MSGGKRGQEKGGWRDGSLSEWFIERGLRGEMSKIERGRGKEKKKEEEEKGKGTQGKKACTNWILH